MKKISERIFGIKPKKIFAFTLAEVLIALTIIGVVAALTVPTLQSNIKKKTAETKLASFYSTIKQAEVMSQLENGHVSTWEQPGNITTSEGMINWWNKYYAKYLKARVAKHPTSSNTAVVYFPDNSALTLDWGAFVFYPDYRDMGREGTVTGKESFAFFFRAASNLSYQKYHKDKGIEPYMSTWDGTREGLFNSNFEGAEYGCHETGGILCTKLIEMNNWKIPDDYPIKW